MAWFPCCCGLTNACCPGVQLPTVFRGTFTSTCACVDGKQLAFIWDSVDGRWEGVSSFATGPIVFRCGTDDTELHEFYLTCAGGIEWRLTYFDAFSGIEPYEACHIDIPLPGTADSESCNPFVLTFSGTMEPLTGGVGLGGCPCDGETWTLTITT